MKAVYEVPTPPPPPPPILKLELSRDEAVVLHSLLRNVGSENGEVGDFRRVLDSMRAALENENVPFLWSITTTARGYGYMNLKANLGFNLNNIAFPNKP